MYFVEYGICFGAGNEFTNTATRIADRSDNQKATLPCINNSSPRNGVISFRPHLYIFMNS